MRIRSLLCSLCGVIIAWPSICQAQWQVQTNVLRAGWNAVYLQVDPSHVEIGDLLDAAAPIDEIWEWNPALPPGLTISTPQLNTGTQWASWSRATGESSELRRLRGNTAILVRVTNGSPNYEWRITGRPVTPTYHWTLSGLNFLGFPTPPEAPPSFEDFLSPAPALLANAEVYRYQGGALSQTNPVRVIALRTTPVTRGEAYWIRAEGAHNRYFGPFQILGVDPKGIHFGQSRSQARVRIQNNQNAQLTVSLAQVASQPAPAGQPALEGAPTLLLRTDLNPTNLTYSYTNLSGEPQSWTLAPAGQAGSEVELIIGLNRSAMTGNPGDQFAAILRFTDSLGLSQVDIGVSAEKASTAGLWVGNAAVTTVAHSLTSYARIDSASELEPLLARLQLAQGVNGYRYEWDPTSGRVLVFGGPNRLTGAYLVDGPARTDEGGVARPFPLRLIIHNDGTTSRLLQKVFHGIGLGTNVILTTSQDLLLPSQLREARRISSIHLPASVANTPWVCTGSLQPGGSLNVTVPVAYDDHASNPFLHTYHPDHDNLDAEFANVLPRGRESHGITRQISLTFTAPGDDFESLTANGGELTGSFTEVVTLQGENSHSRRFDVRGTFSLRRISDIPVLTTQ